MLHRLSPLVLAASVALAFAAPVTLSAQSTDVVLTSRTFVEVAKKVLPGVVSIKIEVPMSARFQERFGVETPDEFIDRFFRGGNVPDLDEFSAEDFGSRGSGSGVIIKIEDGEAFVVTNNHVLEGNRRTQFTITLDASLAEDPVVIKPEDVRVVGRDSLTDIAVLAFKIPDGVDVPVVDFADSDKAEVGEWVLALGNPLDFNNSVSQGIVSARNRTLGQANRIENLLQTTAVINPGNSGGPLVNLDGEIIGINNAIFTRTGRWSGIGFAVPGNQARRVAEILIDKGEIARGYLGISMTDVDQPGSPVYSLRLSHGAAIDRVQPGTPADAAGLEPLDVILEVDGKRVRNSRELLESIANRFEGDRVMMRVLRADAEQKEREVEVVLTRRPTDEELAESIRQNRQRRSGSPINPEGQRNPVESLGLELERAEEGSHSGMRVLSVTSGSPADRAGLREGDLITSVNALETASLGGLLSALGNVSAGADHVVIYRRDGASRTATLSSRTE